MQKISENLKNSLFSQKIKYLERKKNLQNKKKKNIYPLNFPILGEHDSTRAPQSSPLQNPGGGGPLSVTYIGVVVAGL